MIDNKPLTTYECTFIASCAVSKKPFHHIYLNQLTKRSAFFHSFFFRSESSSFEILEPVEIDLPPSQERQLVNFTMPAQFEDTEPTTMVPSDGVQESHMLSGSEATTRRIHPGLAFFLFATLCIENTEYLFAFIRGSIIQFLHFLQKTTTVKSHW